MLLVQMSIELSNREKATLLASRRRMPSPTPSTGVVDEEGNFQYVWEDGGEEEDVDSLMPSPRV